jgi:hypothetical protein
MITVPEEYTVSKFFQYIYQPRYNKFNGTYQGGCCICREGGSLGKKRRCYYIPKNDNIFCHNCGWSSKPIKWVKEVSGKTDAEIIDEIKQYVDEQDIIEPSDQEVVKIKTDTLPKDSINLCDSTQVSYYKNNPIITACLRLINMRRLDTAVNRPNSLYVSLKDRVHKNRLVIPFINENKDIEFYQSRTVIESDSKTKPKYISRIGAEKTLFNIEKLDSSIKSVFIFEGPLNAFFTKNSVAVAGITDKGNATFTKRQQQQVDTVLRWYKKIWVLDSQWIDKASLSKTEILLKEGQSVFIWPEKFGKKFKDFNDICITCKKDEISHDFIEKNTFEGLEGIIRLANIKSKLD